MVARVVFLFAIDMKDVARGLPLPLPDDGEDLKDVARGLPLPLPDDVEDLKDAARGLPLPLPDDGGAREDDGRSRELFGFHGILQRFRL